MAFDSTTRGKLQRFVTACRNLLSEEFDDQLQSLYGVYADDGRVLEIEKLTSLDDDQRVIGALLRERIAHLQSGLTGSKTPLKDSVQRVLREQAFTVLNRFAALRMAEERELVLQCVGDGPHSKGFQVFENVASPDLGSQYERYCVFLGCLFDEISLSLGVLFDRYSPFGLLFPRESKLKEFLTLLNDPELKSLWREDETIGWIYQYFNDEAERKKMREQSSAPRNSRELAVRNQFFTPRYVVEFLIDNTLGRLWYEMARGNTALKDRCRYLVRRPAEIFLRPMADSFAPDCRDWVEAVLSGNFAAAREDATWDEISAVALALDGYAVAEQLALGDVHDYSRDRWDRLEAGEPLANAPLLDQWLLLFSVQRGILREGLEERFPRLGTLVRAVWAAWVRAAKAGDADSTESLSQQELLRRPVLIPHRPLKDPREIRLLDPACGSMHFGLYAFDLLEAIYRESWADPALHARFAAEFGHGAEGLRIAVAENVRMRPGAAVQCFASGKELSIDEAVLVLARYDPGQFPGRPLIYDPEQVSSRRQALSLVMPLKEFDYARAMREHWFTPVTGLMFLEIANCFLFESRPALTIQEAYAAFERDIPRMIVEHNIHGIDIDPRAVQIAGLSLWLRAQRAWHADGVKPADRPRITRSNIVCAEPMPGEKELLREFVEQQFPAGERPAFAFLLEKIFDRMTLAGEAGSLLRIEEEIRAAIAEARALAQQQSTLRQARLFPDDERPEQAEFDLRGLNDEQFWEAAEQRIYDALEAYAEQAENSGGFQRRLFANDAAQGFAFIDLCRKRYDVVVMNPPFGKPAERSLKYLQDTYPDDWKDIYAAFFTRTQCVLATGGLLGAITSLLFLYSKQLRTLRHLLIERKRLQFVVELGGGVLDNATVETSLSLISKEATDLTAFLDLTFSSNRGADLLHASQSAGFQFRRLQDFTSIFGWPLCYHVHPGKLALWKHKGRVEPELAEIVAGNHTFDDFRFLRLRWEVNPVGIAKSWIPYEKGGDFQPFFSSTILLFNWENDGVEARAYQIGKYGTDAQTIQSITKWFKSGISYPRVSSIGFSPRVLPAGCIFSEKGMSIFPNNAGDGLPLVALLSSSWVEDLLCAFGRHRAYENSAVANLPFSEATIDRARGELTQLATRAIGALHGIAMTRETSPFFVRVLKSEDDNEVRTHARESVTTTCDQIDEIVADILFPSDRKEVSLVSDERSGLFRKHVFEDESPDEHLARVLSFCLGSAFGRWDIRYATGEWPAPELPDPFAPLPICPPGMLQGDDGLPLSPEAGRRLWAEGRYPLDVAWDGILVDDSEHPLDLERRVHAALAVLWGDRADVLEQEACALLGVPALREWFRRPVGFFADHLKRYSKSRRQAPIYWPLSTASGSYTLWLYYHRLNAQTLYTCVTDFVQPKLDTVTADADRLQSKTQTGGGGARERAELQGLRDFQAELQELHDELLRVAQLPWKPNLNDGVLITASALWKLFRLPKWQKDLKACWEELAVGDYDWAHLAYTIWPERVREKCKKDRSLAIAHGLEDLCEAESPKPKAQRARTKKRDDRLG